VVAVDKVAQNVVAKRVETTSSALHIPVREFQLFCQPLTQRNFGPMSSDEGSKAREDASVVRRWAKTRGGSTLKARAVLQALRYHRPMRSRGGEYSSPRVNRGAGKGCISDENVGDIHAF